MWDEVKLLLINFLPFLAMLSLISFSAWFINRLLLLKKAKLGTHNQLQRQFFILFFVLLGILVSLLFLPIEKETRSNLLALFGLVISAILTLSSTTFVTNALASLMLQIIKGFRLGDFIEIGEHFGRVTERGLFHTEIQSEDRDLITFPNLYLVTHPIKVIRSSGTIVSATVSLGYEISNQKVEEVLLEAAKASELEEPFVHILELGDFSITYRIAGFLPKVKQILTTRSLLRKKMLTFLHQAKIEIVSPTFMNQRQLKGEITFIPDEITEEEKGKNRELPTVLEAIVFDKADKVEKKEQLLKGQKQTLEEIEDLESQSKELKGKENASAKRKIRRKKKKLTGLTKRIETLEQEQED